MKQSKIEKVLGAGKGSDKVLALGVALLRRRPYLALQVAHLPNACSLLVRLIWCPLSPKPCVLV
jgi:hypothetical protein